MHMYTHDRLWPQFSDLCIELQSHVQLLAANSGGNAFDESVSCIWAALADSYPECSIPMACQSSTVELRGENDVSDELASQDAWGLYRFLQGRGYLQYSEAVPKAVSSLKLLNDATSLDGVDMIEVLMFCICSFISLQFNLMFHSDDGAWCAGMAGEGGRRGGGWRPARYVWRGVMMCNVNDVWCLICEVLIHYLDVSVKILLCMLRIAIATGYFVPYFPLRRDREHSGCGRPPHANHHPHRGGGVRQEERPAGAPRGHRDQGSRKRES